MAIRKPKIELCKNAKGPQRWWYRVKGGNGKIFAVSEKFSSHAKAVSQATRFIDVMQLGADGISGELTEVTA